MTQLVVVDADEPVWRVGFKPEPWAWSGWEWAGTDGRFDGRWDDRQGNFRTVYAGSTLLACLLEVLAGFRPDPTLALELDDIVGARSAWWCWRHTAVRRIRVHML